MTVSVLLQALYLTVLIIQPTDAKKLIMKCLSLFGVELNPPGVGELGLLGLRSDVLLINRGQGLKQRDRHRGGGYSARDRSEPPETGSAAKPG